MKGGKMVEGSSSVEVQGICDYDEDSVSCWTPQGDAAPDLTREIEAKLVELTSAPERHGSIPFKFGRLNRIVVLRTESIPSRGGGFHVRQFEGVENRNQFMLDEPRPVKGNEPIVRRNGHFCMAPPEAETMSILLSEIRPPEANVALPFKKGATAKAGNFAFRILTIESKDGARPRQPGVATTFDSCTVKLEIKGPTEGKRLSVHVTSKPGSLPADARIEPFRSRIRLTGGFLHVAASSGDIFTLQGQLNLKTAETLRVTLQQDHLVRLTDLPLKP